MAGQDGRAGLWSRERLADIRPLSRLSRTARWRRSCRFRPSTRRGDGEAVLYFQFAEDHGWSLALVQQPEGSPATFSCAWDREPPVLHDDFDRSMLKGIVATSDVEPFLVNVGPGDGGTPKAHGFAERLGLPAYRWLSPDYVEKNTQHFIDDGARKLGRKAAKTATTKLPPPTRIALPKPALTAREALELLTSTIKWVRPPWTLRSISGNSEQVWHFTYYNAGRREGVQGYFHSNGSAGFQSLGHDPPRFRPKTWRSGGKIPTTRIWSSRSKPTSRPRLCRPHCPINGSTAARPWRSPGRSNGPESSVPAPCTIISRCNGIRGRWHAGTSAQAPTTPSAGSDGAFDWMRRRARSCARL